MKITSARVRRQMQLLNDFKALSPEEDLDRITMFDVEGEVIYFASMVGPPAGGLHGQYLVKGSDADYDVGWYGTATPEPPPPAFGPVGGNFVEDDAGLTDGSGNSDFYANEFTVNREVTLRGVAFRYLGDHMVGEVEIPGAIGVPITLRVRQEDTVLSEVTDFIPTLTDLSFDMALIPEIVLSTGVTYIVEGPANIMIHYLNGDPYDVPMPSGVVATVGDMRYNNTPISVFSLDFQLYE